MCMCVCVCVCVCVCAYIHFVMSCVCYEMLKCLSVCVSSCSDLSLKQCILHYVHYFRCSLSEINPCECVITTYNVYNDCSIVSRPQECTCNACVCRSLLDALLFRLCHYYIIHWKVTMLECSHPPMSVCVNISNSYELLV